jgi:hypothetical protein
MDGLLSGFRSPPRLLRVFIRSFIGLLATGTSGFELEEAGYGVGAGHRCMGWMGIGVYVLGAKYRAFAPHHQWDGYYCKTWAMIICFLFLFHYLYFFITMYCTG